MNPNFHRGQEKEGKKTKRDFIENSRGKSCAMNLNWEKERPMIFLEKHPSVGGIERE